MGNSNKLTQNFFEGEDTHKIAKELLGKILVRKRPDGRIQAGTIVEDEVYHGLNDKACHAAKARTKRTEVIFGQGGHYYVYLIYGMYWNLNIVTGEKEFPSAILIRALEPIYDTEIDLNKLNFKQKFTLASGPGKLCRWLGIDKGFYGKSVTNDELFLMSSKDFERTFGKKVPGLQSEIISKPRIGVDYSGECALWDWRYYVKDNKFVSKS